MSKKALLVTRVSGFIPQFEMNNVKILQEMGYEIHYAANYNNVVYGKDNSRLMNTEVIRHHMPFGRSPLSKEVRICYRMLKELMLKEEFDLIHCHMPMTGILARKAAEKVQKMTGRKVPVIYTAHGFHFFKGAPMKNWIYYFPERHYARYTDRLLLINKEDYERGSKFPVRGKVEYVSGVGVKPMPEENKDFNLRETYNIPEENKVIVSVGELTPLKNHSLMIKAMDRFRKEPITYLICGEGPLEEELRKLIREFHLEEKVILAGYCSNVLDILRQSDMFTFPSQREGLPVAMMEAMQAGLPIMCGDIRGNCDLLEDGKGGFLFIENLAKDYIQAIEYFLKYPEEAERMGEWNKEKIKEFSIDIIEKKMRQIYKEVESEAENE